MAEEDAMLTIARQPGGNYAQIRLSDFSRPHWSDQPGGWAAHHRRHYSPWLMVYGYVDCDRITPADWDGHRGSHGQCPHRIKVCVIKTATSRDAWRQLEAVVGPRPSRVSNHA